MSALKKNTKHTLRPKRYNFILYKMDTTFVDNEEHTMSTIHLPENKLINDPTVL